MTKFVPTLVTALAVAIATPALALQPASGEKDDLAQAVSELSQGDENADAAAPKRPHGTTPEERANTARLNAEQAARARSEKIAYEQQVQAAAQEEADARASYAEETAAYEAEKARVAAMSAEERIRFEARKKQWEADVAACKAGHSDRCAQPSDPKSSNP